MIKQKFIRKSISNKLDEWLSTITDKSLVKDLKNEIIVTGGCIVSMLTGEKINDFDVFLQTENTVQKLAEYYIDQFWKQWLKNTKGKVNHKHNKPEVKVEDHHVKIYIKSAGILVMNEADAYQYFEGISEDERDKKIDEFLTVEVEEDTKKYLPVCLSPNAITLTDKIQIIIRFYGPPETIHSNFDFIHLTSWYDYKEDKLVIPHEAAVSLVCKEAIFNDSQYPLSSLFRIRKLQARGYKVSAGQIFKIALKLQEFNLLDQDVLYDQLIGVDATYFIELLNILKKSKKKLDRSYIYQIVDKIF